MRVWRGRSLKSKGSPALHEESVSPVVKEKSYFAPKHGLRQEQEANPAEAPICGNAGIRKDLGASSRNSGLPQKPTSSRISSRRFPGESKPR